MEDFDENKPEEAGSEASDFFTCEDCGGHECNVEKSTGTLVCLDCGTTYTEEQVRPPEVELI